MTESKHTPGPWTYALRSIYAGVEEQTRGSVTGKNLVEIASMNSDFEDPCEEGPCCEGCMGEYETCDRDCCGAITEQEANAALIARAPDLLREVEELRAQNAELLRFVESVKLTTEGWGDRDLPGMTSWALKEGATKLLAKAKGGAA